MQSRDLRTLAYVLRRTNYGETDRILNLITPQGKMAAMAKGVRKERSKLAGGIELFSLIDVNLHLGKSELATLTGAKMLKHYANIVKDFERLELAAMVLKKISLAAESSDSPEYFKITDQVLRGLDEGVAVGLAESWFLINLAKAMGEEMNLYRDTSDANLEEDRRYDWDNLEMAFFENENGRYGANEIKMLRLMMTSGLDIVSRVKIESEMVAELLLLVRRMSKI